MYDVLIHLNLKQLPRQHEAVDITKETTIPRYKPSPDSYRLPITDFDPVKMYLTELRVCNVSLSLEVTPWSDIKPGVKIDKPLVV